MIKPIEISVKGDLELNDDIHKYINTKIAKLDRYMNKHARKSVHAEVMLMQDKGKKSDRFTAEVVLHMPGEVITAKEATLNIYAAIDIVEAKLKNQIRKYKEKHVTQSKRTDRKGVLAKLLRRSDAEFRGRQN